MRAIHTPGHRPEHTAFALVDTARGAAPWAVLTGDSLFVGDVARPDLAVEREGARALYRSLTDGPPSLLPETEVWPGHLGGSMCGGPDMDQKTLSTIGFELGHNPILSEASEDGFVERALAGLGPQPPRFGDIVALNRGPLLTAGVRAAPVGPRGRPDGRPVGLLVDVRTDLQFAEAHVPGSVLVTHLRAGFGTKLAWVAEPGQEIVFIGRDDADGLRGPPGGVGRGAQRRRPSRRRNDELARGAPPRGADGAAAGRGPALPPRGRPLAPGPGRSRAGRVGRGADPGAPSMPRTTTSAGSRTGSTRRVRWRSSARQASGAASARACSCGRGGRGHPRRGRRRGTCARLGQPLETG